MLIAGAAAVAILLLVIVLLSLRRPAPPVAHCESGSSHLRKDL